MLWVGLARQGNPLKGGLLFLRFSAILGVVSLLDWAEQRYPRPLEPQGADLSVDILCLVRP